MSRELAASGPGKIVSISSAGMSYPRPTVPEVEITVSVDNYSDFETQAITMRVEDGYQAGFNIGDAITIEEYLTPCADGDGHEVDFEIKPLVLGEVQGKGKR